MDDPTLHPNVEVLGEDQEEKHDEDLKKMKKFLPVETENEMYNNEEFEFNEFAATAEGGDEPIKYESKENKFMFSDDEMKNFEEDTVFREESKLSAMRKDVALEEEGPEHHGIFHERDSDEHIYLENVKFKDSDSLGMEVQPQKYTVDDSVLSEEIQQGDALEGDALDIAADILSNIPDPLDFVRSVSSVKLSPQELAEMLLTDIFLAVADHTFNIDINHYLQQTMLRVADLSECESSSDLSMEEYIWIFYLYTTMSSINLTSSLFLNSAKKLVAIEEAGNIIFDLVNNVIENHEYLHDDSDDPNQFAKSLIWKILNSRAMWRRYNGLTDAHVAAGDVLDEILDSLSLYRETRSQILPKISMSFVQQEEEGRTQPIPEKSDVCLEFRGIYKIAENFIDKLLEESEEKVRYMGDNEIIYETKTLNERRAAIKKRYKFPAIQSFNIPIGLTAIGEFVEEIKSNFKEDWSVTMNFHLAQSDDWSDYYFYNVVFSLPTKIYPVPQATASIYFRIEVSRVKPKVCPIDITYKFESSSLVHKPYRYPFQEQWLVDILRKKLKLCEKIKF